MSIKPPEYFGKKISPVIRRVKPFALRLVRRKSRSGRKVGEFKRSTRHTVGRSADFALSSGCRGGYCVDDQSSYPHCLRLLTYNLQAGIQTVKYGHYLTRGWQHLLPSAQKKVNLNAIASLIREFDIVALQEVDGGSLRSGYINQVAYLARRATFNFWYQQLNRDLGLVGQHSNGVLSQYLPIQVESHRLPSKIPGRGAIFASFQMKRPLLLVIVHLSLSAGARREQLAYIRRQIEPGQDVVIMGDFNCSVEQLLLDTALKGLDLYAPTADLNSFPSWHPTKSLDHVLVSRQLLISNVQVIDFPCSDHLPIGVEIQYKA